MTGGKKLLILMGSMAGLLILTSQLTFGVGLEVNFSGIIKEGFKIPASVVSESSGKIFVLDKKEGKILVFDKEGKFIKSSGEKGKKLGQLEQPIDLAVYKDKLYLLEQGNNRISCFDFDLNFIDAFGSKGNMGGQFNSPKGIAIDYYGNVYVADTKNNRVQVLSQQGIFYSAIEDKIIFKNIVDVAVDLLRNIYILDNKNHKVFKFSPEGKLILTFGSMGKETSQFKNPTSIAVDKKGYIYVADQGNFRIQVFDKEGKFIGQLGIQGKGPGRFEKLISVYVDEQNRLFTCDEKTNEVQWFTQEKKPGVELSSFPPFIQVEFKKIFTENIKTINLAIDNESNLYFIDEKSKIKVLDKELKEKFQIWQKDLFKKPKGIVVGYSKRIYVLDSEKCQVQIFDSGGKFINSFGRKGKERGQFVSPSGIAIDDKENIYLADTGNCRIQIFDKDGLLKNIFGQKGLLVENLQLPIDLVVDSQRNIYVLDQKTNCIKKFTQDGKFITNWGNFLKPTDIFIDCQDVIYVSDVGKQRIDIFNTSGEELGGFGSPGKEKVNLKNPTAMVINKEGDIYIGNLAGSIQLFSLHQLSCFERGNYYLVKGKFDLAQREYQKEIIQNPQNVKTNIKLAELYIYGGKLKEAAATLEEAIKKEPDQIDTLLLLGKVYLQLEKLKEAKNTYRQIIKLSPKLSQVYYELALVYEKEKDYSLSITTLKEALKLHPEAQYQTKLNDLITLWEKSPKNRPALEIEEVVIDRIFSAIYKYYNENPIGKIKIRNNTNDILKQIKMSLFIKEFMDFAWEIKVDELEPFTREEIPLFATFNDRILSVTEDTPFLTQFTLTYYEKDEEKKTSVTKPSILYSKNALVWKDKEMIASFITPQSAVIRKFTKEVIGNFHGDTKLEKINEKLATAMLLFNALSAYKMVYSPDPANPYNQTSLKLDVVDYVQFPFETLKYKSGDCDDLSILYASCLEGEGVNTILVTSPGHIFLMFDTNVSVEQVQLLPFDKEVLLVVDDKIWIPVEVTRIGSSFLSAWYQGAKEYRKWEKEGKIDHINTHKAWSKYQTGTWRDVDFQPDIPSKEKIAELVYNDMETLTRKILASLTEDYEKLLEINPQDITALNQLGIIYGKFGLYDDAIKIFEQAIKINPTHPDGYCHLGNIYYLQEKFDLAITQYELSLGLAPHNAKIHINLSLVYFKKKMIDKAKEEFHKAVELDPTIKEQFGEYKNLLF